MITAVDTNVLIDIFLGDKKFGQSSARALNACLNEGAVIICGVVFVETMPLFPSVDGFVKALETLSMESVTISMPSFRAAALAWKAYRQDGGSKSRMVADFLIGAHALTECDRLLTRDRGFYRKYFKNLKVIEAAMEL
jgi:predicted nucleic acid-binding protein